MSNVILMSLPTRLATVFPGALNQMKYIEHQSRSAFLVCSVLHTLSQTPFSSHTFLPETANSSFVGYHPTRHSKILLEPRLAALISIVFAVAPLLQGPGASGRSRRGHSNKTIGFEVDIAGSQSYSRSALPFRCMLIRIVWWFAGFQANWSSHSASPCLTYLHGDIWLNVQSHKNDGQSPSFRALPQKIKIKN